MERRAPRVGGRHADLVRRSLITLKALTYGPTGGIVAAPTTSLPEAIGGVRNWDYRFCWVRDATLTLQSLMHAGYLDEARAWRDWLLRAVAGSPAEMQIMYGPAGERRLTELELAWLPGYEGSAPVRIGNARLRPVPARRFGELMDAMLQAREGGLPVRGGGLAAPARAARLPRGRVGASRTRGSGRCAAERRHFVALQGHGLGRVRPRGPHRRSASRRTDGPVDRWRELRDRIHREVASGASTPSAARSPSPTARGGWTRRR